MLKRSSVMSKTNFVVLEKSFAVLKRSSVVAKIGFVTLESGFVAFDAETAAKMGIINL